MCSPDARCFHAIWHARLIVAKFIPGLSTLVPPLAGISGVGAPRFFFFDGLGSLLYAGCFVPLGVLFSRQLEQVIAALASLGSGALGLVAGLAALYIGYKYFQRRRLLSELRTARITVDELYQKLEAGENPIVLDLRPLAEVERNPLLIRGARHMTMDEVPVASTRFLATVILFSIVPDRTKASSARLALLLRRTGILRVRPLLGGIDAWRERNYPTDVRAVGMGSKVN